MTVWWESLWESLLSFSWASRRPKRLPVSPPQAATGNSLSLGRPVFRKNQITPWDTMASATFKKPATLAPTTRSPSAPQVQEAP